MDQLNVLILLVTACLVISCAAALIAARALVAANEARRLAWSATNSTADMAGLLGTNQSNVLELLTWREAFMKLITERQPKPRIVDGG